MTLDRRNGMIDDLDQSDLFERLPVQEWVVDPRPTDADDYWQEVGKPEYVRDLYSAHNRLLVLNGMARWQL